MEKTRTDNPVFMKKAIRSGRKGGKRTLETKGKEYFSKMAKDRWEKQRQKQNEL